MDYLFCAVEVSLRGFCHVIMVFMFLSLLRSSYGYGRTWNFDIKNQALIPTGIIVVYKASSRRTPLDRIPMKMSCFRWNGVPFPIDWDNGIFHSSCSQWLLNGQPNHHKTLKKIVKKIYKFSIFYLNLKCYILIK